MKIVLAPSLMVLSMLAVVAAGPAPGGAAPGADRPTMSPKRESSVLYRLVPATAGADEVRITTGAGGSPMRVDMPDSSYMLVNQRARTMAMVVPSERTVLDLPWTAGPQDQFLLNERMRFIRRGADTVAGQRCTVWDVSLDGQRGQMCITDDGVMLRTQGQDPQGRRTLVEAVSVSYAPAPAAEFMIPDGFERLVEPPRPAPLGGR